MTGKIPGNAVSKLCVGKVFSRSSHRRADHVRDIHPVPFRLQGARSDACHVQKIGDEAAEPCAFLLEDCRRSSRLSGDMRSPSSRRLVTGPGDGRQRCAQIMRDRRQHCITVGARPPALPPARCFRRTNGRGRLPLPLVKNGGEFTFGIGNRARLARFEAADTDDAMWAGERTKLEASLGCVPVPKPEGSDRLLAHRAAVSSETPSSVSGGQAATNLQVVTLGQKHHHVTTYASLQLRD